jgi:uncharacterized protein (DUF2267 family)
MTLSANGVGVPRAVPFAFVSTVRASGLPPGAGAAESAAAVMCALESRLPSAVVARLQAALPEELRELLGCAPEHGGPPEGFGREEFLRRVAEHLDVGAPEAEDVTRAVFAGVRRLLATRSRAAALARLLPADLAVLWDDEDALREAGATAPLGAPP